MRSFFSLIILLSLSLVSNSQVLSYADSLQAFQKNYVATHEVVKNADRDFFRFYPVNEKYRVYARFEKLTDTAGFIMKTSGEKRSKYLRYGLLHFSIDKKPFTLTIYQNEKLMTDPVYKDYLFVPFTDLTSGKESYGGGRYLDFFMNDIKNNSLEIDFNKAYNPYCAYATGFNCPIPPVENDLPVSIKAGEKNFAKKQ
jgi:uncharacterized protein (DUF1684 family)